MSAAVVSHQITVLAPGPIRKELTSEFFDRGHRAFARYPVSAEFDGEEFSSPGLAFEDYTRMSTQQHKQSAERRLPTPEWALRPDLLRKVLVHYVERRAGFLKPTPGTESERLARANQRNAERCKRKEAVLIKLCAEFVELHKCSGDPVRTKKLGEQIKNLDTCLRFDCNIAGIALRCVHLYYGAGLDSVGVSTETGLKPPHVRALLWKLDWTWNKIHGVASPRSWQRRKWPRRRYKSKINIRLAARMFAEKKTYVDIGKALGVTPNAVQYALRNVGLWEPRLKPGTRLSRRINSAKVVELYQAGKSVPEIAHAFGHKPNTGQNRVRYALINAGVYRWAKP
jgi:hypothetical protein